MSPGLFSYIYPQCTCWGAWGSARARRPAARAARWSPCVVPASPEGEAWWEEKHPGDFGENRSPAPPWAAGRRMGGGRQVPGVSCPSLGPSPDPWPLCTGASGTSHPTLVCCQESTIPVHVGWPQGDSRPHSLLFLTTGMGTTWKILALWSSVFRVTQVGRKLPLKPTNTILSEKQR